MGFILRMPLEEKEQALSLLHERVDARVVRPRENPITARRQRVIRDLVPPGMRDPKPGWSTRRQVVIADPRALEDAEALVAERMPGDAIDVEQRRVRRQAGPDRRVGVVLGPFQYARQAPPVRLVP